MRLAAAVFLVTTAAAYARPSPPRTEGGLNPSDTLAARLATAERIELAGPVRSAKGFEHVSGAMRVRFSEGSLATVRDGYGEIGVFVWGSGRATWTQGDAGPPGLFDYNVREVLRVKARGGAVGFDIRSALILRTRPDRSDAGGTDGRSPATGTATGTAAGESPESEPGVTTAADDPGSAGPGDEEGAARGNESQLAGLLEGALHDLRRTDGWNFPLRRVAALSNDEAGIEMVDVDGKARAVQMIDLDRGTDTLLGLSFDRSGRRRLDPLIRRPYPGESPVSGAVHGTRESGWRLSRMTVGATLTTPPSLPLAIDSTFVPSRGGERVLLLSLEERRPILRVALPAVGEEARIVADRDESVAAIRALNVRDADGRDLDFVHRYTTLAVLLPSPTIAGTPVSLSFDLDTALAYLPGGHEFFALREPGWYPAPPDQSARFDLTWDVRTRKPFRPMIVGEILGSSETGEEYHVRARIPYPVRSPLLLCGKYVETDGPPAAGAAITVWTYARANPQAEPIARFCSGAVGFFAGLLGPYPYDRLEAIETARSSGGQSGPGILLVEGMDPQELARARRTTGTFGFNMIFAHEIAHQWWGQKVGISSPSDQWLTEALAEYTAWIFVRELRDEYRIQVPSDWTGRAKRSADVTSLAGANDLAGDLARVNRANLIYGKGALMLQAIARETGEEKLLKALGVFATRYSGREATSADFIAVIEEQTGRSLSPIFDEWVRNTGLPRDRPAGGH